MSGTEPFPEGYLLGAYATEVRSSRPNRIGGALMELARNLIPAADLRVIEQKIFARRGMRIGLRSHIPAELTSRPRRHTVQARG